MVARWRSSSRSRNDWKQEFLCPNCDNLFNGLRDSGGYCSASDEREIEALKASARSGCHACAIFQTNLNVIKDIAAARTYLTAILLFATPNILWPESLTPLRVFLQPAKDVKHLFHTAKVEPSTASESSFNCA
jgi:hypothetical protein